MKPSQRKINHQSKKLTVQTSGPKNTQRVLQDCKNINNSAIKNGKVSAIDTKRTNTNETLLDLQKDMDVFKMISTDLHDTKSRSFDKHQELSKSKQYTRKVQNNEEAQPTTTKLQLTQRNSGLIPTPPNSKNCTSTANQSFYPLNLSSNFFENDPFKSILEENTKNANESNIAPQSPNLFSPIKCNRKINVSPLNPQKFELKFGSSASNSSSSKLVATRDKFKQETVLKNVEDDLEDQFSQFCKGTQVIKQLDSAILSENQTFSNSDFSKQSCSYNNKTTDIDNDSDCFFVPSKFSGNFKRKSTTDKENKLKIQKLEPKSSTDSTNTINEIRKRESNKIIQKSNPREYSKEISQLFECLEQSICNFGTNHDINQNYNKQMDDLLDKAVEKTDWSNDLLETNDCFDEFVQANDCSSLGDLVNKALIENATKNVSFQKLCNQTIVNPKVNFQEKGPFYGLPNKIMELIRQYKGIDKLYDWQDECLKLPAIKNRKNLIYSLPTSGGKTLVAEILILREIICRRRNVIFVLPYVAIVQEKVWALSPFGVALDFLIEEYAAGKGTCPPRKRRHKHSVYIATTEKALSLINSLVEQGRIEEIGLVVVDELHLIGEEQRGPTLETLLTKLMYLNESIQIVGMSATIGNLSDIQKFLNAEVYTGNFRPVELTEYVKCDDQIAKINWREDEDNILEVVRTVNFSYSNDLIKIDPDRIGGLVMEVIPKESCLIFCPSKKNCENVTILLCKILLKKLKEYKSKEKQQLLKSLEAEAGTVCDILKGSIPFGIAYHHSGLTAEERRLIEEAYRAEVLNVICCTSTLAAGVNLPAKRVIIRKPYIAQSFISLSRYKQMVGRAGRAGLGELGESILICSREELSKVRKLFLMPMDQTLSKMHESKGICLRNLFLSCIGLGLANTKIQLEKVINTTLLAVQQKQLKVDLNVLVKKVLTDLMVLGAVKLHDDTESNTEQDSSNVSIYMNPETSIDKINESKRNSKTPEAKKKLVLCNNTKLVVSKLGSAAIKSGLDLNKAHVLYEDLTKAQESLVLLDCLHLLYLVTPYNFLDQIKPVRTQYYHIMMQLGNKERKTASILGITESCIIRMFSNQSIKSVPERVLNRFYVSLMLFDLWNEASIIFVAEKYQVDRGVIQSLMTAAATFAAGVVTFCEELQEFWAFAYLLKGINQRLSHCCVKELLPLMELPAVKQGRAKQLFNAGYKNLQSIAKANPQDLVSVIQFMPYKVARQLIAAAKLLLLEKVETLREEAEELFITQTDSSPPV